MHTFKIHITRHDFFALKNAVDQSSGASLVAAIDMHKSPWFGDTMGMDLCAQLEFKTLQDIFFLGMKYQKEKGAENE